MHKFIILIILLASCLIGCGAAESATEPIANTETKIENPNNYMIYYDEEGNVYIDTSNVPRDPESCDAYLTPYQYTGEDRKTADTDEYEDIYGIADQVGYIGAVIKRIDTLGIENNFQKCTIHYSSLEDDEFYGREESFIISLDYDFYIITYYLEEGATSIHDDTGMLADEYIEPEPDIEWFD